MRLTTTGRQPASPGGRHRAGGWPSAGAGAADRQRCFVTVMRNGTLKVPSLISWLEWLDVEGNCHRSAYAPSPAGVVFVATVRVVPVPVIVRRCWYASTNASGSVGAVLI